jgi:hypothetical protein
MNKHEICVHIKDEEMLQKAKELLEKHGEKVDSDTFYLSDFYLLDNLYFGVNTSDWGLGSFRGTEITLDQLEVVLKN